MQSPALAEPKEPAKKSGVKEAFEWIEMLACALVFVVFLFSFVFLYLPFNDTIRYGMYQ